MKYKVLMLFASAVMVASSCLFISNNTKVEATTIVHEPKDMTFEQAQQAMNDIYKSITVLNKDLEKGEVTISIANPSDYDFHNMMVHMEFVNKQREAYYVETEFIFDGLKGGEEREITFFIQDMNMLNELDWFNFCTEGF